MDVKEFCCIENTFQQTYDILYVWDQGIKESLVLVDPLHEGKKVTTYRVRNKFSETLEMHFVDKCLIWL